MTNDTAELRKLALAATPKEWALNGHKSIRGSDGEYIARANWKNGEANAAYIAAANPSVLLALLDRLEAPADRVETEWQPISTCPYRTAIDLWCVYGGEEFAQYDGGASIGQLVSNKHKSEEYGFFGNQSNAGVPRREGPDLVPVAWRKAVPQCPPGLIAEALGVPLTMEDARALLTVGAQS